MNSILSRNYRAIVLTTLALVILTGGAACGNQKENTPLISAAASLADVLEEAAGAYEANTGDAVDFNFGGSIALANQIARLDGPTDGVILAGDGPIDLLIDRGVVDAAKVAVIAENSLVVVSADDIELSSLADLSLNDYRVAIADPELAPAGQFAREALVSAAVWDDLDGQIIPTLDVRAALAAASSGSVDFAIVYATDSLTEPNLNVVLRVDSTLHQAVRYPGVAISNSDVTDAVNAFLSFLLGPEGQQILRNHGFTTN